MSDLGGLEDKVRGLWDDIRRENLRKAVVTLLRRRLAISFPMGDYAHGSRWFPCEDERYSCCGKVRVTFREPMALYNHCCGLEHVGNMFGVGEDELGEALEVRNLPMLLGIDPDIDEWIGKQLKNYEPLG